MWRGERSARRTPWRLFGALVLATIARGADDVALEPANRIAADAPAWRELAVAFAARPDAIAEFLERRFFPFRKEPVTLRGEVRVSREGGLSLHYTAPEDRIVIVDERGLLLRPDGGSAPAIDPRGAAGVAALRHILRLDFAALEKDFELYGRHERGGWMIVLAPRAEETRRTIGQIHVAGEGPVVQTIELRRSAKQHIDIVMFGARAPATFSAEERARYFR